MEQAHRFKTARALIVEGCEQTYRNVCGFYRAFKAIVFLQHGFQF